MVQWVWHWTNDLELAVQSRAVPQTHSDHKQIVLFTIA